MRHAFVRIHPTLSELEGMIARGIEEDKEWLSANPGPYRYGWLASAYESLLRDYDALRARLSSAEENASRVKLDALLDVFV